jgi:hypothetical protein
MQGEGRNSAEVFDGEFLGHESEKIWNDLYVEAIALSFSNGPAGEHRIACIGEDNLVYELSPGDLRQIV